MAGTGRRGALRVFARVAALLVATGAVPLARAPAAAQEARGPGAARAPDAALATLRETAEALARKGRGDEMRAVYDLATELGDDAARVAADRERMERRVKLVRKPAADVSAEAALLRRACEELRPGLATAADADASRALAAAILRIDADDEPARAALGQSRCPDGWVPAGVADCLEKRREIRRVLAEARRLDVPVVYAESDSVLMLGVYGRRGRMARWGRVSVHGIDVAEEKLGRILREGVRAAAVSQYLLTGVLKLPVLHHDIAIERLATTPDYERAVAWCAGTGMLSADDAQLLAGYGSFHYRGRTATRPNTESDLERAVLEACFIQVVKTPGERPPQPTLRAGHQNWVCQSYLGCGLGAYGWLEKGEERGATSDLDLAQRRREDMWQLAEAGLLGSRAWLRYLAERGEDPAWSSTFLDQMGKITGDALTKATFVTEYLHETGRLATFFGATAGKPFTAETFEDVLGTNLAAFEQTWHAWMLAPDERTGLVQVLEGATPPDGEPAVPADTADVLKYLDGLRREAVSSTYRSSVRPLRSDTTLSAGCLAHARYLMQNPEQMAAWPDAHEEWPDRPGFSTEGSWAGLHSVIAPGTRRPRDAIDGWMATFYHRLPLIEPGLVRIGWGFDGHVAVLDSGSMVAPFPRVTEVVWPPRKGKDVPRRFQAELPHPVPGEDQSTWGYPVTLQLVSYEGEIEVAMQLLCGDRKTGTPVDCHYSTPQQPTNPEIAPEGAYCLIPKAVLAPNTRYTVVAASKAFDEDVVWSFTTGD